MKISEIPFEDIKIGTKVVSAIGTPGIVKFKLSAASLGYQENDFEKHEIEIEWINGSVSRLWHIWGNNIEVVE